MAAEPIYIRHADRGARILVVDDNPLVRRGLLAMLERGNYQVETAESGLEALALLPSYKPDLVLLDIQMSGMDGLEVCRRIKDDKSICEIPVIFITTLEKPQEETAALAAGAVDFISKPVNPDVLRARVQTHLTLKAQSDLLRSQVYLDGLTGIANRRRFDEIMEAEWRRLRRNAFPLTLVMVDIDHFKNFNDRYGHQAGDVCLKAVAHSLVSSFRRSHDLVARYGGEEFACILPETDLPGAGIFAETLLNNIHELGIPHEGAPAGKVTASMGVATMVPPLNEGPEILIRRADGKLYEAKRSGRNRVVF